MEQLSARERLDVLLRNAEATGLAVELRDKVEAKLDIERKQCVAELKRVRSERVKAMLPYIEAKRAAEARDQEAQAHAAETALQCSAATISWLGMQAHFDGLEYTQIKRLNTLAPAVLGYTDIKLDRLADRLVNNHLNFHKIVLHAEGSRGIEAHPASNVETINQLRAEIKAKRALLSEMIYLGTDAATAEENCRSILADIRGKAAAIVGKGELNDILGVADELPPPERIAPTTASESFAALAVKRTAA
jgi:hypothetical protein